MTLYWGAWGLTGSMGFIEGALISQGYNTGVEPGTTKVGKTSNPLRNGAFQAFNPET